MAPEAGDHLMTAAERTVPASPTRIAPLSGTDDPSPGLDRISLAGPEAVDRRGALAGFSIDPQVADPEWEIAARRSVGPGYAASPLDFFTVTHAWVEPRMCVVIDRASRYLVDTLRTHRQAVDNGYTDLGAGVFELPSMAVRQLSGRAALIGLPCGGNYFHWWIEAAVRYLMVRDRLPRGTTLLVQPLRPMERSVLEAIGAPMDSIKEIGPDEMLLVDELIVPPRGLRGGARLAPEAIRTLATLRAHQEGTSHRVFVSRRDAGRRRIVNEADVFGCLRRYGFEEIACEALSVEQQIATFSTANAVVSMHGAALANVAFCTPASTLIEFQPPRLDDARLTLYWNLAAIRGVRYVQVICARAKDATDDSSADIVVDVPSLERTLVHTLGPPF
jgi:capsular polysaccharide biosynthesis protein